MSGMSERRSPEECMKQDYKVTIEEADQNYVMQVAQERHIQCEAITSYHLTTSLFYAVQAAITKQGRVEKENQLNSAVVLLAVERLMIKKKSSEMMLQSVVTFVVTLMWRNMLFQTWSTDVERKWHQQGYT